MSELFPNDNKESNEARASVFSKLTQGCSALQHRDFRLLWIGTFASSVGSWMQKVATAWLIYQITNSTAWLGIDAFASGMPTVLLLPWGGVWADRLNRRSLLIWTNVLAALLAFVLAALVFSGGLQVWHIVVVSALSGVVQSLMVPASTSLLPQLVGEKDTANAIALNSLQFNLSRVIGPAVGGIAIFHLGASWSFLLNGLSFLVLVVALAFITKVPLVNAVRESVSSNLRGGLRFVQQQRNILTLLILVVVAALLSAPMISMMPALTKSVLHREARTYSLLLSSFGVGAVVAAAVVALMSSKGAQPWLALPSLIVFGICEIAVGFQLPLSVSVVLVTVAGFTFISTMIRLGTAILQGSPNEYRGRVTSFQSLGFRAAQPVGSLLAGFLAHGFGVRVAFWIFGALMIAASVIIGQVGTIHDSHQRGA